MNAFAIIAESVGAAAAIVTAFSILYVKLVKPVKKVVDEIAKNKEQISGVKEDLKIVGKVLKDQNDYDTKNRAIMMKSMIAILDGLEQNGANGNVTKTKKELINYMAKNLNGKR
jgi:preprotein translocase subunit SecY